MANYYGVDSVQEKGNAITNYYGDGNKPRIGTDESLILILNNGLYEIAVDATDDSEFKYFYNQYAMGFYLSFRIYKINKNKLIDCPDTGRKYI